MNALNIAIDKLLLEFFALGCLSKKKMLSTPQAQSNAKSKSVPACEATSAERSG